MTDEQQIIESWRGTAEPPETLSWMSRPDKVRAVLWCLGLLLFLTYIVGRLNAPDMDYSVDRKVFISVPLDILEEEDESERDMMKGAGVACLIRTMQEFIEYIESSSSHEEKNKVRLTNIASRVYEENHVLLYISAGTSGGMEEDFSVFFFNDGTSMLLAHNLHGAGGSLITDVIHHCWCLVELLPDDVERVREVSFLWVYLPYNESFR